MNISIIVTTYNRPAALAAVLRALAAQQEKNFEVIIADDGSSQETQELINQFRKNFPVELIHAWHEDRGFRAGAVRNLACSYASGNYLIFLDGDCVPQINFVAQHTRLAEHGFFVAGNRILLNQKYTNDALDKNLSLHEINMLQWLYRRWIGDINRWSPLLVIGGKAWRKYSPERWQGARTCNLGIWMKDFVAVNGFDEVYTGWGHEDADLAIRMIRNGVKRKDGRFSTAVLHLWHAENDRTGLEENKRRLTEILKNDRILALHGLNQYKCQKK